MVEKFPHNFEQGEPYEPTDEELAQGFVLGSEQTVVFDISPNRGNARARRDWEVGNGVKIEGMGVAVLRLGSGQDYAEGAVINTLNAFHKSEFILILSSSNRDFKPVSFSLSKDRPWGLGRSFERQNNLPDTVSRQHCVVSLDESDRFVLENQNPTNETYVRRFQ
ncbi:MAG: FHA domain-containing protein [Candidatus Saccharimonadales bacterium]